jgi:hypothetical protein
MFTLLTAALFVVVMLVVFVIVAVLVEPVEDLVTFRRWWWEWGLELELEK